MATADQASQDGQGGEGNPSATETAVTQRPDTLPEAFWDSKTGSPKYDELGKVFQEIEPLRALKTAADERATKIPAKAEDYPIELPKDFALPEGMKWEAKNDDPLAIFFRNAAKEAGLTTDQIAPFVKGWANLLLEDNKALAGETDAAKKAAAEDKAKLGANADQRITAAKAGITALAEKYAPAFEAMLSTSAGVEALEFMQKKFAGVQLAGNSSQTNGQTQPPKSPAQVLYGRTAN